MFAHADYYFFNCNRNPKLISLVAESICLKFGVSHLKCGVMEDGSQEPREGG